MREFFRNIESYKIYNLIIVATVSFVILASDSFRYIQNQLLELGERNRLLIAKDIQYATQIWMYERISNIENIADIIDRLYTDENRARTVMSAISHSQNEFDAYQLIIPDRYFYVQGTKVEDYREGWTIDGGKKHKFAANESKWYLDEDWFTHTRSTLATTMQLKERHGLFQQPTINMCTPILDREKFEGVLCGIIKTASLLQNIGEIAIPEGGYYYVIDSAGEILASYGSDEINLTDKGAKFSQNFYSNFTTVQNLRIDNDIITIDKLRDFDWYIAVGLDRDKVKNEDVMQAFFKHTALLLGFFVVFIVIVNGAYAFLHSRSSRRRREYEQILAYNTRMGEVGELVSAINHQLRQPLNSLSLIISGTLDLLRRKEYDIKSVVANLKLSRQPLALMDKTINIFRNFYRSDEAVSTFKIKEAVQNVLYVMHTNLSHNNITVEAHYKPIEGVIVESCENFVQQILLVLIQNANDAYAPMQRAKELKNRRIEITFEDAGESLKILVADFGCGIKKGQEAIIFSSMHKSQKKHGFGMGLFFAKKLAQKRLGGDLELINHSNPTTFCFTLKKQLKDLNAQNNA
jgi:signal transduction histidine kinase